MRNTSIFFTIIWISLTINPNLFAQDSSGVSFAGRSRDTYSATSLTINEGLVYVCYNSNYLHILDIADPQDIDLLGRCSPGGGMKDIVFGDGYVYLATAYSGFKVVDVQDPTNLEVLDQVELDGRSYGVAIAGDYAYATSNNYDRVYVIDISDPARPEQVRVFDPGTVRGVAVAGEYLYLVGERFHVMDISNPEDPEQVASFDLPLYGFSITIVDDRAYVSEIGSEQQGDDNVYFSNLRIIDISDPEDPTEMGVFGELPTFIYSVAVSGNFAYLAASSHLRIVDISDPENITEVGYYQTSGSARDVVVAEPFAYVAQTDYFTIYDCSNAIGEPDLEIAEEDFAHDFGEAVVGLSESWSFPVQNTGHFQLTIGAMEVDDDAFVLHSNKSRWSWQGGFPAGAVVRDRRLGGVAFVEDNYYITGGNSGGMVNWVYVFNRDGEQERRFEQFNESAWGMRDLAWDGELLWGSDGGTVYGFTLEGELETEFEAPLEIIRSLAWDPQSELLWVGDLSSSIFGVDREGNIAVELDRLGVRVYGMAWYPEDTDGFQLYLATWNQERPLSLHKVDVETGEMVLERETLDARIGERFGGGLAVTNELNPPSWDLVALVDGATDAVEAWQLTDYYHGETFVIPAEEEALITVEFMPTEAQEYEGILTIFSNDEEEAEIQISLTGTGRDNRAPEWVQLPESVETEAGQLILFDVQGEDPDGNPLQITLERGELPYRARLEDFGNGTATFSWQTDERDIGEHTAILILSDKVAEVRVEVPLDINSANSILNPVDEIPLTFRLDTPYPNPFNSTTTISYGLPQAGLVSLQVYNPLGQQITTLFEGYRMAGVHSTILSAEKLPTGLYFVNLKSGGKMLTSRLMLIK